MTRTTALALAAALAAACGGPRQESRQDRQEKTRGERRGEAARGEGRGEAAGGDEGGRDAATSGEAQAGVPPRDGEPRIAASPQALLGPDTVVQLQQALVERRLLGPHRRGELDTPTSAAVRQFQQQQGLAATGVPDRETLTQLGVSAEHAYGSQRGER
jgi:hypothetical protein